MLWDEGGVFANIVAGDRRGWLAKRAGISPSVSKNVYPRELIDLSRFSLAAGHIQSHSDRLALETSQGTCDLTIVGRESGVEGGYLPHGARRSAQYRRNLPSISDK